jgi:serine protease Do
MGAIRAFEPADLGLKIAFVGKEQAGLYAALGMPPGAVVLGVEADKPAGRAGIHAGDVIVAIEGRKIDVEDDLRQALKRIGSGKTRFAIKRGDEARTLVVDCPDCKE